jgi:hypothetical protein
MAFLGVACSAEAEPEPHTGPRIPDTLARLTLAEGREDATPIDYGHALHLDPEFAGRELTCSDCHHQLRDNPSQIPERCGTCHPPVSTVVKVREDEPHEHGPVPDL